MCTPGGTAKGCGVKRASDAFITSTQTGNARTLPKAPRKMHRRFPDQEDRLEGEPLRFLAFLRDHDRAKTLQSRDLPVDVEHLRLEKSRAIRSDDGWRVRHA